MVHNAFFSTAPTNLLTVVVASTSKIKQDAVRDAFKAICPEKDIRIVGVDAKSGQDEQPVGEATYEGAKHRIKEAKAQASSFDAVVSIESGIFYEDDCWMDHAVVCIELPDGTQHIERSEGVKFPSNAVDEASNRGFAKTTVGMVMQEWNIVKDNKDPHSSLGTKKPRALYIQETLETAVKHFFATPNAPIASSK